MGPLVTENFSGFKLILNLKKHYKQGVRVGTSVVRSQKKMGKVSKTGLESLVYFRSFMSKPCFYFWFDMRQLC